MRFYYLDPGLKSNAGHHASTCRVVTGELRRRGIETLIAASTQLTPELATELGASPFFAVYTYTPQHPDPIAGWLKTFLEGVAMTTQDLARLPAPMADDVVFVNSAQPTQLMAVMTWLNGIAAESRPRVVVEFGTDAGVNLTRTEAGYTLEAVDPRENPRSVLLRHVGQNIPPEFRRNLFLKTFDAGASKIHQLLLDYEIGVLPLPQQTYGLARKKAQGSITIGVLGRQDFDKGYQLLPEILPALLARHAEINILVHNANPDDMPPVQQKLREIAQSDARITLDEGPANSTHWQGLLAQSDVILCPYRSERYLACYSALAVEALANGIPIVAPEGTVPHWFVAGHKGAIVPFGTFTAPQIVDATSSAIAQYERLAVAARAAAEAWNSQDRKAQLVDSILGTLPIQVAAAR